MTFEEWQQSLAPKVQGTWNLHNFLLDQELDFFILLSSLAGVVGNASQAGYCAASTFQDAFAEYRNSLGLPAVSLDLGMVNDVGYVSEREVTKSHLESLGFRGISEQELMSMLHYAICNSVIEKQPGQIITKFGTADPNKITPGSEYNRFSYSNKSNIARHSRQSTEDETALTALRVHDTLLSTKSFDEAVRQICSALVAKLGLLVMAPIEEILPTNSLAHYGMDSLVAVEMRNWLGRELEVTVPILELLANQSIVQLSEKLAKRSKIVHVDTDEKSGDIE
jgi:hypothetical protein